MCICFELSTDSQSWHCTIPGCSGRQEQRKGGFISLVQASLGNLKYEWKGTII